MSKDFTPFKGYDAIDRAGKAQSGKYRTFAPQIRWNKDGEEKFILVISPMSETYSADLHQFVEVGTGKKANGETYTKFEEFASRKQFGEKTDDIEDRLNRQPRRRTIGVAVELDPVFETVRGRKRPKSFVVKTEQFTRKTEDGEVEVEAPVIGMVTQAYKNFYGWLVSFDRQQAPSHETPMQVIRRRTDSDTSYDFIPFMDAEVDFEPLFDGLENVGYLREEAEGLLSGVEDAENTWEAAAAIGTAMVIKRWEELTDEERYHTLIDPIDELPPSRFGTTKKDDKPARASRPARKSARDNAKTNGSGKKEEDRRARFADLRAEVEGEEVEA